jgi:hypothetical protein
MKNLLTAILLTVSSVAAPVHLSDEVPLSIKRVSPEVILVDFGQVSFGNIRLVPPAGSNQQISVHFGEDLREGRVNRKPQGTVRYATTRLHLSGSKPVTAAPAADGRDTQNTFPNTPPAVLPPPEWALHMIFMAHADYRHTGDTEWLSRRYESLKPKLLLERARKDGLLVSSAAQTKKDDIVD